MQIKDFHLFHWIIIGFGLTILSCRSDVPLTRTEVTKEVSIPAFNRDSAFAFVEKQLSFGPRNLGSAGHTACKEWIVATLRKYGSEVQEQNFTAELYTGESFPAVNILAFINPRQTRRIALAAHWDTRHIAEKEKESTLKNQPILGADDGASGVAVLLELARTIQNYPLDLGVDMVFFDAEDHGDNDGATETWCLGSQYWSRNLKVQNRPMYGILLDMVGSKGASFRKEGVSLHYAGGVVEKVWSLAHSMGYHAYFLNTEVQGITDDHLFVNRISGLPMINIINHTGNGFGHYHHTQADNLDIIDRNTLRVVGQVITAVLYRESNGSI